MNMLLKDGKRKVLTFSYDDGTIYDKKFLKIISEYGLKGTININGGLFEDGRRMSLKDAKELYSDCGQEIAIHGYRHLHMHTLDKRRLLYEIAEDKKSIEKHFGGIARGMAFPYGTWNNDELKIMKLCGIEYGRTTRATYDFCFPENWLTLHPTCHHTDESFSELADRFINDDTPQAKMFYFWGHSYEFNDNDNWNLIERFAENTAGKRDIWYATNIQIFDYVKAYKSLIQSYDGNVVYNPSALTVWVENNGNVMEINPGEMIEII